VRVSINECELSVTDGYKVETVTSVSVIHDHILATFGSVTFRKKHRFVIDRTYGYSNATT